MEGLMSFFGNMFGGSGGGVGGASLLSTAANVGSLFSSGLSAFSALQAGKLEQSMYEIQAQQKRLEARQVATNAEFEENALRRKLMDDNASTQAFFAGRGFSINSGTARSAQIESRRRAAEDYNSIAQRRDITTAGIRGNAAGLVADGIAARGAGRLKAISAIPGILKGADSLIRGGMEATNKGNSRRKSLLS